MNSTPSSLEAFRGGDADYSACDGFPLDWTTNPTLSYNIRFPRHSGVVVVVVVVVVCCNNNNNNNNNNNYYNNNNNNHNNNNDDDDDDDDI